VNKLCNVTSCTRESRARGLCPTHASQFYKKGLHSDVADPIDRDWHVLVDVDRKAGSGTCTRCGPVVLQNLSRDRVGCPGGRRNSNLNAYYGSTFGLAPEDKKRMLESQDDKCAICLTEISLSKTTHIDHDHETGQIRGILCNRCNMGLGLFKDSSLLLSNAIAYLDRSETSQLYSGQGIGKIHPGANGR
jgi:hypothetical protein